MNRLPQTPSQNLNELFDEERQDKLKKQKPLYLVAPGEEWFRILEEQCSTPDD